MGMETLFVAVGLCFLFFAILTIVMVIRDVFPLLNQEDQAAFRDWTWMGTALRTWRRRDRAIGKAWDEHLRLFPKSRKRVLFAALLIAAVLSIIGYPLWFAFTAP